MESNGVEFIDSIRGGKLLLYNNYIYRMDRRVGESREYIYWKCRMKNCRSRLKVVNGEVSKVFAHCHNHVVAPEYIERLKTTNKLKKEIAKNPDRPVPEIYKKICAEMDADDTSNDGDDKELDSSKKKVSLQSIDSSLYRYRRKFLPRKPRIDHSNCDTLCIHANIEDNQAQSTSNAPKSSEGAKPSKPTTSSTVTATKTAASNKKSMKPGKWITTYDGDKFLVVNDASGDKILAFVTPEFLDMLCATDKAKITANISSQSK